MWKELVTEKVGAEETKDKPQLLAQFLSHWDKKPRKDLKGLPLSPLWLDGEVGRVAGPSGTRSQSLIFNISILSQEENSPLGLKQQLFLISLFKTVNKLDKEATLHAIRN